LVTFLINFTTRLSCFFGERRPAPPSAFTLELR
jgi:hypothetical protein